MSRKIEEYKETNNPSVYKKLRKELLANGSLGVETYVRCSYCKVHRSENGNHKKRKGRKPRKRR